MFEMYHHRWKNMRLGETHCLSDDTCSFIIFKNYVWCVRQLTEYKREHSMISLVIKLIVIRKYKKLETIFGYGTSKER